MFRVLCALTNSLIPGTFPTEVLVNDRYICMQCSCLNVQSCRWTINLVLKTFSKIVCAQSHIDSGDLRRVGIQTVSHYFTTHVEVGIQRMYIVFGMSGRTSSAFCIIYCTAVLEFVLATSCLHQSIQCHGNTCNCLPLLQPRLPRQAALHFLGMC